MNRGFDNAQARFPWISPHKYCSCGIQSLHHSLLILGLHSDLSELLRSCPVHKNIGFGHEASLLMSLARSHGARPENLTTFGTRTLHSSINRALKSGSPVILGSNPNRHWLVLAGRDGNGGYVWMDSADDPLADVWDWEDIEEWIGADEQEYEAIAIHQRRKTNRSLVPHMADLYEALSTDVFLAGEWGLYLADLDTVFNYPRGQGRVLEAATFLDRNEEAIVQAVIRMEPGVEKRILREVFTNFRTIADYHSLTVPVQFEKQATAQMAIVLRDSVA